MADTGSPYFLPYPTLSDQCDAPKFTGDLALATHARLADLAPRMARWKTAAQALTTSGTYYNITFEIDESPYAQVTPGITYAADGTFTVQKSGVWLINCTTHIQVGASTIQRLMLSAYSNSSNLLYDTYAWNVNTSSSISKAQRFLAGENFTIRGMASGTGCVIYGLSTIRWTSMDATWIRP